MEEKIFEFSSLEKNNYLWNEKLWNRIISNIEDYKKANFENIDMENLGKLLFMYSEAYRDFKRAVKDLSLIMKCRVKGDNDDHFGGRECSNFMIAVKNASDNYLIQSEMLDEERDRKLENLIKQIRNKAISDEKIASKFEKKTKQEYLIYGIDNTMQIFDDNFKDDEFKMEI